MDKTPVKAPWLVSAPPPPGLLDRIGSEGAQAKWEIASTATTRFVSHLSP
jgi:hypothetical protein